MKMSNTFNSRYLKFDYLKKPQRKSGPCFNTKSKIRLNILWKRGEIAPGEQFLPFSTIF